MKRTLLVACLVGLALVVVAGPILAQDERPRRERTRPAGDTAGRFGGMTRMDPKARMDAIDKAITQLGLEGETKDKVAAIQKEYAAKLEEQQNAAKEAAAKTEEEVKKAREAGDEEKARELMRARGQTMREASELVGKYEEAVKGALSAEQKAKFEELTAPPIPARVLLATLKQNAEALALTEEQKASLKPIEEEYGKAVDMVDMANLREKLQVIRSSDKTAEEKRDEIQKLMAEMQKNREQAEVKDRECLAKIDKILNADQQKKLRELARKQTSERRPGAGRERPQGAEGQRERPRTNSDGAKESDGPKPDGLVE